MKCLWARPLFVLVVALTMVACADEIRPPDAEFGKSLIAGVACSSAGEPTCAGELTPEFSLRDFQPESPTFETKQTLEDYRGKTTVVALLAGW
jgi:hypothetical protein